MSYVPRIKLKYQSIRSLIMEKLGYVSVMQVPKMRAIIINKGIGSLYAVHKEILDHSLYELDVISAQKPVVCVSKKNESGFGLREGTPSSVKVTLRNNKMYEFFDRLITIVIPRIKDFRGMSLKSFDDLGNYNIGVNEQIIFPEILIDKIKFVCGMNISIVINSSSKAGSYYLLKELGFPFEDKSNNV